MSGIAEELRAHERVIWPANFPSKLELRFALKTSDRQARLKRQWLGVLFSEQLPAVEQQRHRAVVDERHVHVLAEATGGDFHSLDPGV